MNPKKLIPALFVTVFILFGTWIIYGIIFPKREFTAEETVSKILVVAREKPYFHFTGLDQPHYYVIRSQKYPNDFRINNEVLDLVQDNDSISKAVKEIKYGDTLYIYLIQSSIGKLNRTTKDINIIGLANQNTILIDPSKIEKYYKQRRANNIFSLFVIAILLLLIVRKKIFKRQVAT